MELNINNYLSFFSEIELIVFHLDIRLLF